MTATNNYYSFFENNIHPLTPYIAEELGDLADEHGEKWLTEAMKISAENGKRRLGYIRSILERWRSDGYGTLPAWQQRKTTSPADEWAEALEKARE